MIHHRIGHKTASINTFKEIEIIQRMFSNHNGIKLEINKRKKFWKFTDMRKLKNTILKKLLRAKEKTERKL